MLKVKGTLQISISLIQREYRKLHNRGYWGRSTQHLDSFLLLKYLYLCGARYRFGGAFLLLTIGNK